MIDGIPDRVLRAIRRIVRRISEHSRFLLRETGLTLPQIICLKAVSDLERDDATVGMVSSRVQLSPATVSRIMDRLERAHLVVRERRAKDRRKVCLSLTPAGVERVENLPTPLQDVFVKRLGELPDAEQLALLDVLERVVSMMAADDLDAAPILTPDVDVKRPDTL